MDILGDAPEGFHSDERVKEFIKHFREQTKTEPNFIIRAPGRINLIGDHIDYHGFSVLPMAINHCILMGVSVGDTQDQETGEIKISNRDSERYKPFQGKHSFAYGCRLDSSHQWYHYVLCGYHGVLVQKLLHMEADEVFEHSREVASDRLSEALVSKLAHNLNLFIDSDLPPACGLSSSSALVCASAVATLMFLQNSVRPDLWRGVAEEDIKQAIATNCSKFEHLIGTNGGGMDQAVIMTAQEDYAKYVEFFPKFNCTNVRLPQNVVWLVSHCGKNYAKAATLGFNTRVLETKLAAALILKRLRSRQPRDHTLTLAQVKQELCVRFGAKSTADIISPLKRVLLKDYEALSVDEICKELHYSREQLCTMFKTTEQFLTESGLNDRVQLLKRCLHVFEEAHRVEQFKTICEETKDIHELGRLMTESHESLRTQYECSHPRLDQLVKISLEAGALGARLTGAGWGGCIVSMVESEKCDRVFAELEEVSKFTFRAEPHSGCSVMRVKQSLE